MPGLDNFLNLVQSQMTTKIVAGGTVGMMTEKMTKIVAGAMVETMMKTRLWLMFDSNYNTIQI
jgi:glycerol-3-phosphate responsive antiterminator